MRMIITYSYHSRARISKVHRNKLAGMQTETVARGGSCRPEPVRRHAPQGSLRKSTASRDRAQPAEAPSVAQGEGTAAAPTPFTEFTLSEAEGFRAAAAAVSDPGPFAR